MNKLLKSMLAALALVGLGAAHSAVITFDDLELSQPYAPFLPFFGHTDGISQNGFAIDTYSTKAGANPGDLVGVLVDGTDVSNTCFGLVCPSNGTNYLAMVNDGLPDIYRLDNGAVKLTKFDASFIAAAGDPVLATALALVVEGYLNGILQLQQTFYLPGPVGGGYSFATYELGALFSSTDLNEVAFRGYACTTLTTCTRSLDKAQFALDNITFADPVTVPEPETWLLMGIALAGAAVARRRRA